MEEVTCSYCGKVFLRSPNRIHEAIKFGWRQYCSIQCHIKGKSKKILLKCSNPNCQKTYLRQKSKIEVSGKTFCSNSCAAKITNKVRKLNKPIKCCANIKCRKVINRRKKYCSVKCQWIDNSVTDEEYKAIILWEIQEFYSHNKRIPFKKEMWNMYHSGRRLFGTWNKAIIAAGFKPNPVLFANKHIANDGHKCDSMAEKIIDDWLFRNKIIHKVKTPYYYHNMTFDFKINSIYVEFFGLRGEFKAYDRLIKEKEKFWKDKHLNVIKIYPSDLFPINKLNKVFAKLI